MREAGRTPLRLAILLGLLGISPVAITGEILPIRTYGTADRLASDHVDGVLADSRGFLWFYTADGLSRFDGYTFATYTTADGLPHRNVLAVMETAGGEYFAATARGLARFDPRGARGTERPPFVEVQLGAGASPIEVDALAATPDGRLWCGTEAGLFVLDRNRGTWMASRINAARGPVTSLAATSSGAVWAGLPGEIRLVRPDGATEAYPLPAPHRHELPRAILEGADGALWVGTKSGVGRSRPRLASGPVVFDAAWLKGVAGWGNAFLRARDGTLLVATTQGLWRETETGDGSLERLGALDSACDREMWGLAEDRDANLWLATACGALRVDRRGFIGYGTRDGLAHVYINSIFESRAGDLIVTNDFRSHRAVNRFDGKRFVAVTPRLPESIEYLGWGWGQTVLQDREGAWWVPITSAALRYPSAARPEKALRERPEWIAKGAEAFRLFEDSRGDVWISTIGPSSGLLKWNRTTGRVIDHSADVVAGASTEYTAFAETRTGALWIATSGAGLLRYARGRFERIGAEDGAPADYLRALYIDDAGRLWIASNLSGLVRVDNPDSERPRFARYTTAQGLLSNNVWSVTTDALGRVYAGTSQGLERIDLATGRVKHFTSIDGLPKGKIEIAYRDRAGRLWFGSMFGLAMMNPEPDRAREPPRTLITGVRIAGVTRPVSSLGESSVARLDLEPLENSVSIDFLGLGASLGEELKYQYKLEGSTGDWSAPVAERTVTFAHLAPGSYRLLVRAVDAYDLASPAPAAVAFVVAAPVWQRAWFLALTLLVVSGTVYALHRYRVARLLEVERVRTRIATDLHDDIGSNLTRIAILSEVAQYTLATDAPSAARPLASIARISRESVAAMSDIVWAIKPKRDSLDDLLRRMRRFAEEAFGSRGVELAFGSPEHKGLKLDPELPRQVFLVFKEAVTNALRHSNCTRAEIEVRTEGGRLVVVVADDGRGFDAAADADGNGLESMRKRAVVVDGALEVESVAGRGTRVTLTVPLGAAGWFKHSARPSPHG